MRGVVILRIGNDEGMDWGIFPDGPHNSKGFATVNDLKLVARTFPADLTQQRRFYNLIYTVRPFIGYREWVFI
ncbi:unnamed protein product, partial [marine sediment metagenome]